MKFDFTYEKFSAMVPNCANKRVWFDALVTVLPKYEIDTELRVAMFLAQCAHESNSFSVLKENLNYSTNGLLTVFPKYFNASTAVEYARQPEKIANRVYEKRMGNGSAASGDGFKYRGRGVIQLTGKTNYKACSIALYGDETLVVFPDRVSTPEVALLSACWFWKNANLNSVADAANVVLATKLINGGATGLSDRVSHYNRCASVLGLTK